MGDLVVDYGVLESSTSTLHSLKSQFDSLKGQVSSFDGCWGKSEIQDAMHEFGGNWDYRRDIISGKLEDVGKMCESCLDTLQKADQKLADDLRRAFENGSGK